MTLVTIDLSNVASGTRPGDKVFFWAPHLREGTTTAREEVTLVDGLGEVELKPGPVMVHIRAHGVADTGSRLVTVPDEGPVDLNDLLEQTFTYTPPVMSQVARDAQRAVDAAERAETAVQEGADQAVSDAVEGLDLMERSTAEGLIEAGRWWRPRLRSGDTIDDKYGTAHVGLYQVTGSVDGLPKNTSGWVEVTHDVNSSRTMQQFTPSSHTESMVMRRIRSSGTWRAWEPLSWHGVILGSSDHADDLTFPHAYAVNTSNMGGLPVASGGTLEVLPAGSGFGTTIQRFTPRPLTDGVWIRSLTSGTWTEWTLAPSLDKVESLIPDGSGGTGDSWRRGNLTSAHHLDDYVGSANQGIYGLTSAVGGHPLGTPGWMTQTYDPSSGRTRQAVTASSPTDTRSVARTYSGGMWSAWTPATWHGSVLGSADHADSLTFPHAYAVNVSTMGGLPVASVGTLEVLPAGSGFGTVVQRFTPRPLTGGIWVRSLTSGTWSAWTLIPSLGTVESLVASGRSESTPITFTPTETPATGGSVIVQSLSQDRRVGFNALTSVLRQTTDEGATWTDVRSFAGMNIEWCRSLPDGEIMVETTSTVNGVSGVRRIWVSAGYDRHNPTAATWEVTLTAAAPLVKFADWSISITDEMILLAEYGPKQGVVWGSGTVPIGEGLNARYVYRSYDNGRTWDTIFDLNTFLLAGGRTTADGQHLHGVAWDPYWDRIWVTFGDATNNGSNGVLYSDDEGQSWHAAYWTHLHPSQGWQVVGIQPMRDCVLFAGDMTPSGVMRLDRAQGKHPDTFEFEVGWDYSDVEKHLCQQIIHFDNGRSESSFFAFSREGSTSPSFIVATKNGWDWDLLWVSSDNPLPGIRTIAGPTRAGNLIAAVNSSSGWRQIAGPVDAY